MNVTSEPRSRRAILLGALAAASGAVAVRLGQPLAAEATVSAMETGTDNAADAPTRLSSSAFDEVVLGVATSTMPAFEDGHEVLAIGSDRMAYPAVNVVATNPQDALAIQVAAIHTEDDGNSTGIRVQAGRYGVRAEQQDDVGAGLLGTANGQEASGVEGQGLGYSSAGVFGWSPAPAGVAVVGTATGTATGGRFTAASGPALEVNGRARFTRSGRALVPRNRSYVDITVLGGMSTSMSIVLATIQTYRSGVSIAGVRLNYPTSGKARIYLTKVGSTTATTPVGWFVIG